MTKTIISCAVTGGADTAKKNPAVPVTPAQIAQAAIDARNAGATIAHIHVRDPKTGLASQSVDYYREVVERIRGSDCDILINLTTGPGSRFVPSDDDPRVGGPGTTMTPPLMRVRHVLELRPDICSLDVGSMNFGETGFVNTPGHLRIMAKAISDAGVKPELEVFEPGHIMLARKLIDDGYIGRPPLFQICLGIPWGAPATPESMMFMREPACRQTPCGRGLASRGWSSRWSHRPSSLEAMCGWGSKTISTSTPGCWRPAMRHWSSARSSIVRLLGADVATPEEARKILGLQ